MPNHDFCRFSGSILFLSVLLLFFICPVLEAADSAGVKIPSPDQYQEIADGLLVSLDRRANPETGLCPSYAGDSSDVASNGAQIYDTGLRLLAGSKYAGQIIRTFARNNSSAASPANPQTMAGQFSPKNGVLSWIRIQGFAQPAWWETWEWSVKAGENAWLGKGALQVYRLTGDPPALQFAQERADFILALQDQDGGVRIGPRGLADDFWWHRKSTENNESALSFLDELFQVTGIERYRQSADRIYAWIVRLYDRENHVFSRGEVENGAQWQRDGLDDFAADTTHWLPLDRLLADDRFGANRQARLAEVGRMLAATRRHAGVMHEGKLAGISYSPRAKKAGVISLEWTSQYALLCLQLAGEFALIGDQGEADKLQQQYADLVRQLLGYLSKRDGEQLAAHAIYADGRVAAGEPMWDDTARTPQAFLSAASHLYIGFALRGRDPLRLRH